MFEKAVFLMNPKSKFDDMCVSHIGCHVFRSERFSHIECKTVVSELVSHIGCQTFAFEIRFTCWMSALSFAAVSYDGCRILISRHFSHSGCQTLCFETVSHDGCQVSFSICFHILDTKLVFESVSQILSKG